MTLGSWPHYHSQMVQLFREGWKWGCCPMNGKVIGWWVQSLCREELTDLWFKQTGNGKPIELMSYHWLFLMILISSSCIFTINRNLAQLGAAGPNKAVSDLIPGFLRDVSCEGYGLDGGEPKIWILLWWRKKRVGTWLVRFIYHKTRGSKEPAKTKIVGPNLEIWQKIPSRSDMKKSSKIS